jgi:hypothetical protein
MTQSAVQSNAIVVPAPRAARPLDEVRFEREQLLSQLDRLRSEHRELRVELSRLPEASVERRIRSERVMELDERISTVEKGLAVNFEEMNEAVPTGTAYVEVDPGSPGLPHLPPEYVALGSLFMFVTFLPLSVAFARRLWRRGAAATAALPEELLARMNRMEHIVEATALEVERIGEGQRFMTSLMNENLASSRDAAPAYRLGSSNERGMPRDAQASGRESPLPGMITPV